MNKLNSNTENSVADQPESVQSLNKTSTDSRPPVNYWKVGFFAVLFVWLLSVVVFFLYFESLNTNGGGAAFSPTPTPIINKGSGKNDTWIRYCHPDEDEDFTLSHDDGEFYYYVGEKVIEGGIYQEVEGEETLFRPNHLGEACPFVLTRDYDVEDGKEVADNFDLAEAWQQTSVCTPENGYEHGVGAVQGAYSVNVTGFKISKSYIEKYGLDANPSLGDLHIYEFYVEYDGVTDVGEKSHVVCITVEY